jgi:hypothetical protein
MDICVSEAQFIVFLLPGSISVLPPSSDPQSVDVFQEDRHAPKVRNARDFRDYADKGYANPA